MISYSSSIRETIKDFIKRNNLTLGNDTSEELNLEKFVNDSMANLAMFILDSIKTGVENSRTQPFAEVLEKTIGKEYKIVEINPFLCKEDVAYFLNKVAKVTISKGTLYYWSSEIRLTIKDKHMPVRWKEGDKEFSSDLNLMYELEFNDNKYYLVPEYPINEEKNSVVMICKEEYFNNSVVEHINNLYKNNSLFINKVSMFSSNEDRTMDISILNLEDKKSILSEKNKDKIESIKQVVNNWHKIPKGLRKQGLIMYGPPGTGKTSCVIELINSIAIPKTVIFVQKLYGISLSKIYDWLGGLNQPSIVVCEDFDSIQINREIDDFTSVSFTNVLLSVLDGHKNHDVITIGTTNHPDKLDKGIIRHGRMGCFMTFEAPSLEEKKEIIKLYLSKFELDYDVNDIIDHFADDNILGCYIYSVLKKAKIYTILGKPLEEAIELSVEEHEDDDNLNLPIGQTKFGFKDED